MKIINVFLLGMITLACPAIILSSDFDQLKKNYLKFNKNICFFSTANNTITKIEERDKTKKTHIVEQAKNSYIILDNKVIDACKEFVLFKKTYGNSLEKSLYQHMSTPRFLIRLLEKRPLVFVNSEDDSQLRNARSKFIPRDFTKIGTLLQEKPLILTDYLSYDETQLAALLGISSPTFFINNGNRHNKGDIGPEGSFEEEGIYIGLVGARFEKQNFMEWQHIVITEEQNTATNGYGIERCNEGLLKIWSDLYECKFPTYQEAALDTTGQYVHYKNHFFNIKAYKKRIEFAVKPFLYDANKRGKDVDKKVYVHTVGLGLGVWEILPQEQKKSMIEVYKEIIQTSCLPYITDLNFSWFGDNAELLVPDMRHNSICFDAHNNPITIHFSQRNPADKLIDNDKGKLLVASYAWDGNAYPGNEYWAGTLTSSGDPAAACCSEIATLQNILINPWIKKNIIKTYKSTPLHPPKK